jgi:hypothetical protein
LVESGNRILNRTKLRFVYTEWWRAVRGVNGLAMNGLAKTARPPLTPLRLAKLGVSLDRADDVIHKTWRELRSTADSVAVPLLQHIV